MWDQIQSLKKSWTLQKQADKDHQAWIRQDVIRGNLDLALFVVPMPALLIMTWALIHSSQWLVGLSLTTLLVSMVTRYALRRHWEKISPAPPHTKALVDLAFHGFFVWAMSCMLAVMFWTVDSRHKENQLDNTLTQAITLHRYVVDRALLSCSTLEGREDWRAQWDNLNLDLTGLGWRESAMLSVILKNNWELGVVFNCWSSPDHALTVAQQTWLPVHEVATRNSTQSWTEEPLKSILAELFLIHAIEDSFSDSDQILRERLLSSLFCAADWSNRVTIRNPTLIHDECTQGPMTTFGTQEKYDRLLTIVQEQLVFDEAMHP